MKRKNVEIALLISITLISIFGIIMIYSASNIWAEYKYNDPLKYVRHQFIFFIVGYIMMIIISKIDYKKYFNKSNLFILGCILLLILVTIPGIGMVRNGSRSWFGVGSFGIQPSEFTKLALIIFTSKYLVNNEKNMNFILKGVLPILGITLFIFALIMLQPDFGTGIIIVMSIIGLLFVGGVKLKFFIGLGLIGILGITGLILVAPYRLSRIMSFINPWSDPLGSGFQIIQSLYAIGPGGLCQWR